MNYNTHKDNIPPFLKGKKKIRKKDKKKDKK